MDENRPLTFAEVLETHRNLAGRDPFYKGMTLPEFSRFANEQLGTDAYSAGVNDSQIKRVSATLDRWLKPASDVTGAAGEWVTKQFTDNPRYQEMGRGIGESLPRGLGETAAAVGGIGAVMSGAAPILGGALALTGLGSSFAGGYEKTGSPAVGAVQATALGLLPAFSKVGGAVGRAALGPLTLPETKVPIGKILASTFTPRPGNGARLVERAGEYLGTNLGAAANQELALQATDALMGQKTPLDEHLINLFGAQLPFALFQVPGVIRGPRVKAGQPARWGSEWQRQAAETSAETLVAKQLWDAGEAYDKYVRTLQKDGPEAIRAEPIVQQGPDGKVTTTTPDYSLPPFVIAGEGETAQKIPGTFFEQYSRIGFDLANGQEPATSKAFAKKYKISPAAAEEILGQFEKRGLLGPRDRNGARPVIGKFSPDVEQVARELLAKRGKTPQVSRETIAAAHEASKSLRDAVDDALFDAGLPRANDPLIDAALAEFQKKEGPGTLTEEQRKGMRVGPEQPEKAVAGQAELPLTEKPKGASLGAEPTRDAFPFMDVTWMMTGSMTEARKQARAQGYSEQAIDNARDKMWAEQPRYKEARKREPMETGTTSAVTPSAVPPAKPLPPVTGAVGAPNISRRNVETAPSVVAESITAQGQPRFKKGAKILDVSSMRDLPRRLGIAMGSTEEAIKMSMLKKGLTAVFLKDENRYIVANSDLVDFSPARVDQPSPTVPVEAKPGELPAPPPISREEAAKKPFVPGQAAPSEARSAFDTQAQEILGEKAAAFDQPVETPKTPLADIRLSQNEQVAQAAAAVRTMLRTVQGMDASVLAPEQLAVLLAEDLRAGWSLRDASQRQFDAQMENLGRATKARLEAEAQREAAAAVNTRETTAYAKAAEQIANTPHSVLQLVADTLASGKVESAAGAFPELVPTIYSRVYAQLAEFFNGHAKLQNEWRAEVVRQTRSGRTEAQAQEAAKRTFQPSAETRAELEAKATAVGKGLLAQEIWEAQRTNPKGKQYDEEGVIPTHGGGKTFVQKVVNDEEAQAKLKEQEAAFARYAVRKDPVTGQPQIDPATGKPLPPSSEAWKEASGQKAALSQAIVTRLNTALSFFLDSQFGFELNTHKAKKGTYMLVAKGKKEVQAAMFRELATKPGFEGYSRQQAQDFLTKTFWPKVQALVALAKAREDGNVPKGAALDAKGLSDLVMKTFNSENIYTRPSFSLFNSVIGTERFFKNWFAVRGVDDSTAAMYTDVAMKIAAMYEGVHDVRIAEMMSDRFLGLALPATVGRNAFIGLMGNPGLKVRELNVFALLQGLGHELTHQLLFRARGPEGVKMNVTQREATNEALRLAGQLDGDARAGMIRQLFEAVVPKEYFDIDSFERMIQSRESSASLDPDEFLSDFGGLLALGLARPDKVSPFLLDTLTFGDPHQQQFARGFYASLKDIAEPLAAHFDNVYPKGETGQGFANVLSNLEKVFMSFEETQLMVDTWKRLEVTGDPTMIQRLRAEAYIPSFRDTVAVREFNAKAASLGLSAPPTRDFKATLDNARIAMGLGNPTEIERHFGVSPKLYEKFYPSAQLGEKYPILRPAFDLAFTFRSFAHDNLMHGLAPFLKVSKGFKRPQLDPEAHSLEKNLTDPRVNEMSSRVGILKQENGKMPLTDEQIKTELRKTFNASDEQIQHVINFHRGVEESMPHFVQVILKGHENSITHQVSEVLMTKNRQLMEKESTVMAQRLVRNAQRGLSPNMQEVQAALVERQALLAEFGDPAAFNSALEYAQAVLPKLGDLSKALGVEINAQGLPEYRFTGFMSEMRLDRYHVAVRSPKPDGTTKLESLRDFKTKAEAARFAEQQEARGFQTKAYDRYDGRPGSGMNEGVMQAMAEIERAAMYKALTIMGEDTPEYARFKETFKQLYTPGVATLEASAMQGTGKFMAPRELVGGREHINMPQGFIQYAEGVSNGYAKQYAKERAALIVNDPLMRENPTMQKIAREHIDTVLNPPTKEWTAVKAMNFTYNMAFNLGSMIIELAQPAMTFAPFFTEQGASIRESYGVLRKAAVTIGQAMFKNEGVYKDKALGDVMKRLYDEQVMDQGIMQEFYNQEEMSLTNLRKLTVGETPFTKIKNVAVAPAVMFMQAARWLYSHPTRWNSHLGAVAAFHFATEHPGLLKGEAVYDFVKRTVRATNFGGGQAARPPVMFSGLGKAHGAVGAMYSLQTYTFSTIAMMARMGTNTINKTLPVEQRAAARRAFGQMLFTSVAASGALGLPIAGALLGLIDEMFPTVEAMKNLRKTFSWMDEELGTGSFITDVALRGPLNKVTGMDFAARIGLGEFMGVSPYDGFSLANAVGPTAGIVQGWYKSLQALQQGEVGKSVENAVPNSIRKLVKLYRDDGDFRDDAGRLLVESSPAQQLSYAVGFRPVAVQELREKQRLINRSEEVAKGEMGRFHNELADQMSAGDVAGVRQALITKAQGDSTYDPRAGARRVVEILQARRTPVDPVRSGSRGNAAERERIARTYGTNGNQRPAATEVQQLLERKQAEQMLQMPGLGQVTRAEMTVAQMIDRVMAQNPTMSRQTAQMVVDRLMGRQRPVQ